MATDAQIEANRRNAQRSTGPRTPAGKQLSSRNATLHGLTSKAHLIAGEDPNEFAELQRRLFEELRPATDAERVLVEKIARDFWRLQRIPEFEAALFSIARDKVVVQQTRDLRRRLMPSSTGARLAPADGVETRETVGRTVQILLERDDVLTKLHRHEAHYVRQVRYGFECLEKMRQSRLAVKMQPTD